MEAVPQPHRMHDPVINRTMEKKNNKSKNSRVPQSVIDTLIQNVPVLELIKESTPVRSIGSKHSAHCPFHTRGDSATTLKINTKEQKFECSECGFHGSAIGWLMYHDGLSFQDSIQVLATRADVDVSQWITAESIEISRINKRSIIKSIEHFYCEQLAQSDLASIYTRQRGLSDETLALFGVGYAPADADSLEAAFPNGNRVLWNEGLLVRLSNGEFGRRFKDRLIFPIRDSDGHTVGFGGRALGDTLPKYLNSPSSPVFNKSQLLYGLYESTIGASDINRFILVEGYMDVLTLHQHGFNGAIATLGTSPSEHHINAIFSRSDHLIACFDGDPAGLKAAERLLLAALPYLSDDHRLEFALLQPGQDPDSLIRHEGKSAFEKTLNECVPADRFLHDTLARSLDLSGIGGKAQLASRAQPIVEKIASVGLRESTIGIIEASIGIPWFDNGKLD